MKKILLAINGFALLAITGRVFAVALSAASSQQISINVVAGCVVMGPPAFVFAPTRLAVTPVSVSIKIGFATVRCQAGTLTDLGIDAGLHAAANQRRMADSAGTRFVPYTLSTTLNGADIGTAGLALGVTAPFAQPKLVTAAAKIPIFGNIKAPSTLAIKALHTDMVNYYVGF